MEKENEDQLKEAEQLLNTNNDEDSGRRRRQSSELNIPNNQNLLAQITSTGVLLKPLDAAESTLDFVFVNKLYYLLINSFCKPIFDLFCGQVLNVRESEIYPPLLTAEDLKCLEGKLNVYQNEFTSGERMKSICF